MFLGLVTRWRCATLPTRRSPFLVTATTDGVVRSPSAFVMTSGFPATMYANAEFVVPRSIPIILLIYYISFRWHSRMLSAKLLSIVANWHSFVKSANTGVGRKNVELTNI